ncbi:Na(+)/H(+) antiporter subunit E1 [Rhodobacteraceae bacterium THAF1]|uniref:Na+/H+ antiporter subunit E n=1 Tax=Palleronia sp. THAF1 TaxID=2587842 RepID=UPI000F3DD437|nr:Na+/H+ antiporter subunit E [Palleronia sp. THAF1]QFU07121.1 Na(+)/H(+) antiporter subunit E1 [Palleronia sp. THAF1]VDC16726.1 Na(+)/H(+) antiporter subunit E1 [Rhodobacteraceae bacterium THAF1]
MIKRLFLAVFPHPMLTLILVLVYVLLTNSFGINSWVMGLVLGVVVPIATHAYWPDRPRTPKPFKLLAYMILVIWDILVANVKVAFIVLFRSNANMRSHWVVVPLDLKSPEAITLLAGTITLTPGTVSADLSDTGRCLLVHALDTADPEQEAKDIKHRYERRLKEIFE